MESMAKMLIILLGFNESGGGVGGDMFGFSTEVLAVRMNQVDAKVHNVLQVSIRRQIIASAILLDGSDGFMPCAATPGLTNLL